MIIQDIYEKYQIPPHLQLHMLRVAWVCKLICEHRTGEALPVHDIITVWLTHDLGNILKFDMDMYPEVREPEWVKYRKWVKESFKQYWTDEYEATKKLASLCKMSASGLALLEMFDEYNDWKLANTESIALRICDYADARVTGGGVTTLHERITTLQKRNMKNHWRSEEKAAKIAANRIATSEDMEKKISENSTLSPEDISDETVNPLLEDLRKYDIISS